jgi:hypothetical protein
MSTDNFEGNKAHQSTQWDRFVAYRCLDCSDRCINVRDTVAAKYRRCRACISVPELDGPVDDDLEDDLEARTANPSGRQAARFPCGGDNERPEDGRTPGTRATASASPERRERSEASDRPRSVGSDPSTAIGDAALRLAYRKADR